VERVMGIEPT